MPSRSERMRNVSLPTTCMSMHVWPEPLPLPSSGSLLSRRRIWYCRLAGLSTSDWVVAPHMMASEALARQSATAYCRILWLGGHRLSVCGCTVRVSDEGVGSIRPGLGHSMACATGWPSAGSHAVPIAAQVYVVLPWSPL